MVNLFGDKDSFGKDFVIVGDYQGRVREDGFNILVYRPEIYNQYTLVKHASGWLLHRYTKDRILDKEEIRDLMVETGTESAVKIEESFNALRNIMQSVGETEEIKEAIHLVVEMTYWRILAIIDGGILQLRDNDPKPF